MEQVEDNVSEVLWHGAGWGHQFRGAAGWSRLRTMFPMFYGTEQAGDTISGVLRDGAGWVHPRGDAAGWGRLVTPFQGSSPWQALTRGCCLSVWSLRVPGVYPHTPPPPHLRGRGRAQLPARARIPGIRERGGPRCPLTRRDDTSPLLFLLTRRRGQPHGWRWLPRRDKAARLSRHNGSVRMLARMSRHGGGVCTQRRRALRLGGCWGHPGVAVLRLMGRTQAS